MHRSDCVALAAVVVLWGLAGSATAQSEPYRPGSLSPAAWEPEVVDRYLAPTDPDKMNAVMVFHDEAGP